MGCQCDRIERAQFSPGQARAHPANRAVMMNTTAASTSTHCINGPHWLNSSFLGSAMHAQCGADSARCANTSENNHNQAAATGKLAGQPFWEEHYDKKTQHSNNASESQQPAKSVASSNTTQSHWAVILCSRQAGAAVAYTSAKHR